jgi:hypothetical protein
VLGHLHALFDFRAADCHFGAAQSTAQDAQLVQCRVSWQFTQAVHQPHPFGQYASSSTLAAIHWQQYTGSSTLAAVHWQQYTGSSTLAAVHWLAARSGSQVSSHPLSSDTHTHTHGVFKVVKCKRSLEPPMAQLCQHTVIHTRVQPVGMSLCIFKQHH